MGWPTTVPRVVTVRPASSVPSGISVPSSTAWAAPGSTVGAGTAAGAPAGSTSSTSATCVSSVSTISAIAQMRSASTSRPMIHGQTEGPLRSTLMSAIEAFLLPPDSTRRGCRDPARNPKSQFAFPGWNARPPRRGARGPVHRPTAVPGGRRRPLLDALGDPHAAPVQLGDGRLGRHALVRREDAALRDPAVHLHHARDRERETGRPLHRADAGLLVVVVEQVVDDAARLAVLLTLHLDPQRHEVPALRPPQPRLHARDEQLPRHHPLALHLHR